jgi:dCMP deaminase
MTSKALRPDIDTYFMSMAILTSSRASCIRRKVGCILVNKRNHVMATGYNGPASGQPNCLENPCAGAHAPSGEGLNLCEAIHAEANALLQCPNVWAICTAYVTASPCIMCTKLLLNTSCKRIVFLDEYPHPEARILWERAGRAWHKFSNVDLLLIKSV